MKNYIRITLSGLLLTAILAASFWVLSPGNAQAEGPDLKIPAQVRGKQFTIEFGNGDKLTPASVVEVVLIGGESWWKMSVPTTSGNPGTTFVTVNPRQIRLFEDLR
jgi:hypothetical protein